MESNIEQGFQGCTQEAMEPVQGSLPPVIQQVKKVLKRKFDGKGWIGLPWLKGKKDEAPRMLRQEEVSQGKLFQKWQEDN